jgi:hypothetical protein
MFFYSGLTLTRNINVAELNLSKILVSYYNEVVNILINLFAGPLLFAIAIQPLSFKLAQTFVILMHACGALSVALGSTISCVHILYVTNFEYIFSLDPKEVGRIIFVILVTMTIVPDVAVGIYSSAHGFYVDKNIRLFTQVEPDDRDVSFLVNYSLFWVIVFFSLSFLAFVCIPLLLKRKQSMHSNQQRLQNSISIKRYLLTMLGFFTFLAPAVVFTGKNNTNRVKLPGHCLLFSSCLMLAYRLAEKDARNSVKRYLFSLCHIEDTTGRRTEKQTEIALQSITTMPSNEISTATIHTSAQINFITVSSCEA